MAENTVAVTEIGDPVAATDANLSDTLTYSLSGTDGSSFDINGGNGQLMTKAALDHETKGDYTVGGKVGRVGGRLLSIGDQILYRLPSFIGL